MVERKFWEDAKKAWVVQPPPKVKDVKTGPGGTSDRGPREDLWDADAIPFDSIDYDAAMEAAIKGEDLPIRQQEIHAEPPAQRAKPRLNKEEFDELMESKDMGSYIGACHLLMACELPRRMDEVCRELTEQMAILQESAEKFKDVYHTDLDLFYEYYIPEALQVAATYLEYIEMGIDEEIVRETENEVMQALGKLLLAVKEKKNEIYRFASIELKAKAKALESLMSQDGFVDPNYKMNKGENV